ncbi:MAG: hypothetical protein BWK76_12915 [Desulfobulbaceae bacterium A2]|nr:MAG: hypothetical protein BWK76_12915 [Desulfobulbaceae bacterium A2]
MIKYFAALRRFLGAVEEHRAVEQRVLASFEDFLDQRYRRPLVSVLGRFAYAQKNFFSSLFLSIYQTLDITPDRRSFYGVINHCLRGIVTGADNLLDAEYKEMLPLDFAPGAIRFKSVMHILLFDRILCREVRRAADEGIIEVTQMESLHKALLDALVPIGAEEASEEGGVDVILSPAEICSSVHMFKGGKLLCLAFVAPLHLEANRRLRIAEAGVYSIGMALQLIDDLTDLFDDIRDRRHNYLASVIQHEGLVEERGQLERLREGAAPVGQVETMFPNSVRVVMARAIGEAASGFDRLSEAGHWIEREQAMQLIRFLFRLRGVKRLLDFFPSASELRALDGSVVV